MIESVFKWQIQVPPVGHFFHEISTISATTTLFQLKIPLKRNYTLYSNGFGKKSMTQAARVCPCHLCHYIIIAV